MSDSPFVSEDCQPEFPIGGNEQRQQLHRILDSDAFRNSPGLQKFLEYVTCKTIDGLSAEIKEYAIGVDVFGKAGDYDPKVDTTVRVQANRLREKLRRYYEGQGAADPVILAVPKGHYIPSFSRRIARSTAEIVSPQASPRIAQIDTQPAHAALTPAADPRSWLANPVRRRLAAGFALGVGATVLLLGGLFLVPRLQANRALNEPNLTGPGSGPPFRRDSPVTSLWSDFLKQDSAAMVGYSNSIFLATQNSDLLRVDSEEVDYAGAPARTGVARRLSANPRLLDRAGPVFFEDLYTGTGEVMAVYYITRLFTETHSALGVKRGRLVTIADLSQHDMIFLGSTVENNLLAKLPLTQDFTFSLPVDAPHLWGCRVANLHPRSGERPYYETERDPKTQVLRADYALVSFLPGLTPSRRIAVLGGLTTIGTQAAAEFATSAAGTAELLQHLGTGSASSRRLPPYFQALLRVEIMKGDVLRVEYVTGHPIQSGSMNAPRG